MTKLKSAWMLARWAASAIFMLMSVCGAWWSALWLRVARAIDGTEL